MRHVEMFLNNNQLIYTQNSGTLVSTFFTNKYNTIFNFFL